MLGRVEGIEGVLFDFGLQFLAIDSLVDARYELDFSPEFRKVVEGFVQGLNDIAIVGFSRRLLNLLEANFTFFTVS